MVTERANVGTRSYSSSTLTDRSISFYENPITITDQFDFVLWMGDFNYRINCSGVKLRKFLLNKQLNELLLMDQLKQETISHRLKINNFNEAEIKFFPTYKYEKNSNILMIDEKKLKIPGWTDRIM